MRQAHGKCVMGRHHLHHPWTAASVLCHRDTWVVSNSREQGEILYQVQTGPNSAQLPGPWLETCRGAVNGEGLRAGVTEALEAVPAQPTPPCFLLSASSAHRCDHPTANLSTPALVLKSLVHSYPGAAQGLQAGGHQGEGRDVFVRSGLASG